MNDYELRRVIDVIDRTRAAFAVVLPLDESDAGWRIVSHLVRENLAGRLVNVSALIQASGLPYGTGSRRIQRMVDDGQIEKRKPDGPGKRYFLVPSPALFEQFRTYANLVKIELERTISGEAGVAGTESFFGGAHQWNAASDEQVTSLKRIPEVGRLRFLLHDDYYFLSIRHMWSDFRRQIGPATNFEHLPRQMLHQAILDNGRMDESAFDIVAVDGSWIEEFGRRGLLHPLNGRLAANAGGPQRFDPRIWRMGAWRDSQLAIPAYASFDLLAVRRDILGDRSIDLPRTMDDFVRACRACHNPEKERYGLAWSAARGAPVAQTFRMLAAGFIKAPPPAEMKSVDNDFEHPSLADVVASPRAAQVLDLMHRLKEVAPPDVLGCDQEAALQHVIRGQVAMGFLGSIHATRCEIDIRSKVRHRMAYLPVPLAARPRPSSQLNGFFLAIPANLGEARAARAYGALTWLSSSESVAAGGAGGFPISSIFSLRGRLEQAAIAPIHAAVDQLARGRQVTSFRSGPRIEDARLEQWLGEELHHALSGAKTDAQALESVRHRLADAMAGANGATAVGGSR